MQFIFILEQLHDISYSKGAAIIRATKHFIKWLDKQGPSKIAKIDRRLQLINDGQLGFHRQIGQVFEIKWRKGELGATRIYCLRQQNLTLLIGGSKASPLQQHRDIAKARLMIEGIKNGTIRTEIYG